MKLGKSTGPSSKSVELLGHLKTMELILSQHYSTKSMTGQIPPDIPKSIFMALPKETRGSRVWIAHNEQFYESYHHHTSKNDHDVSRKQNQTKNSRGTVRREKVQQVQSLFLNYDWTSPGSTKKDISVLHWLHRGIWQNTTRWDNHTNTFEDRWKRSKSNLKHVLGTDSSNASWWKNQLI